MQVKLPDGFEFCRWYLPQVKERKLGPQAREFTRRLETDMRLWVRFTEAGNKAGVQATERALSVGVRALRKLVERINAGETVN